MFRAIGVIAILWYLSLQFSQTFSALDDTLSTSLETLEATITASQNQFVE